MLSLLSWKKRKLSCKKEEVDLNVLTFEKMKLCSIFMVNQEALCLLKLLHRENINRQ